MNASDLTAALDKFAASDLRAARKNGDIMVTGTKRGTLSLSFDGAAYTLATVGMESATLATGKPADVRPVLASLYTVN